MMTFPFIEQSGTLQQFINSWSHYYDYGDEAAYTKHITNNPFSKEDVRRLFLWKNGMRLSVKKNLSLETKIVSKLDVINRFKQNGEDLTFPMICDSFSDVSAIWLIFIAHIINAQKFPIFDQHVYRAMIFLQEGKKKELNTNNGTKLMIYEREYLAFYNSLLPQISDYKEFDEAMWTFGRFMYQYR